VEQALVTAAVEVVSDAALETAGMAGEQRGGDSESDDGSGFVGRIEAAAGVAVGIAEGARGIGSET
jgi:hypothetical protein